MTAVSKPIAAALLDQAGSVRLLGRLPAAMPQSTRRTALPAQAHRMAGR